jgi:hypothetical protein
MMYYDWPPSLKTNDLDWGLNRVKDWKLKLCWQPRTCFFSGRRLWGQQAYHGVQWISGPGDPVCQEYWIEQNEFLLWKLKK